MTTKNTGRGSKGSCGGTRRRDGSGGGTGNRGTKNQPKKALFNKSQYQPTF